MNMWNKSLLLLCCLPRGCSWGGLAGYADPESQASPPWLCSSLAYPNPMGSHPCNLALWQPGTPFPVCAAEPCASMPEGRASQQKWITVGSALSWSCEWLFGSHVAPGTNMDLRHMMVRWVLSIPQPAWDPSGAGLCSIPFNHASDDSYRIPRLPHGKTSSPGLWGWDPSQSQCVGELGSCSREGPTGVPKVHGYLRVCG